MKQFVLLLVDDVELFLDIERSFLHRESFQIHTAASGEEALRRARELKPDLVLLDLFMRDMEGDRVCRELKSDPATRNAAVVMVSSVDDNRTRERCQEAGCDAFVAKPLRRDRLLAVIEECIEVAQRQYRRVPAHLQCTMQVGGRELSSWIHIISTGGCFVEALLPPAVGEEVQITFRLPRTDRVLHLRGEVRWTGSLARGDSTRGAGVEFSSLRPEDRQLIRDYVDSKSSRLLTL